MQIRLFCVCGAKYCANLVTGDPTNVIKRFRDAHTGPGHGPTNARLAKEARDKSRLTQAEMFHEAAPAPAQPF